MTKNLIISLIALFPSLLFVGCERDIEQDKIGNFEFYIDSIYNITETSVTIQATLFTEKFEKRIIGLEISGVKADGSSGGFTQPFDRKEGTVTMTIENLEPNTEYIITPMVKLESRFNTSIGSAYSWRTFTTKGDLPKTGTVEDIDGNIYHFITIGDQTWMVENLRTTRLRDGTPIPHVKDSLKWCLSMKDQALQTSLSYCDYNNDSTFGKKYGHIYDIQASKSEIAPKGWHVPTRSDWFILRNYLIANGYNYDKSTEEDKIARSIASNTTDWLAGSYINKGSIVEDLTLNNITGFTALPGGYRSRDGEFKDAGYSCNLWSSTPYYQYNYYVALHSSSYALYMDDSFEKTGMYIRCIRNN